MSTVVLSSDEADARAVEAVEQHHAQLAGSVAAQVERLVAAASAHDTAAADTARAALVAWCQHELVPHATAEEDAMYPPAHAMVEGCLLVGSMIDEHQVITGLVAGLETTTDPVRAAALATALRVMFDSHLAKENELVLPLLDGAPDVSVAELLDGIHQLLGGEAHDDPASSEAEGHRGRACGCNETDAAGYPELDARSVPHAIRHATIFGEVDAVAVGQGMVLVAPHDPLPLLAQIEQRPGAFDVTYLERGPEDWRLQFIRVL